MSTEARHFGPDDDLMVHLNTDGKVQFTTRGHDAEELTPEDVRELIAYLRDLTGEPVELTPADLEAMRPGDTVLDMDDDVWTKQDDGLWKWYLGMLLRSSNRLVASYGPIRGVYADHDTPTKPTKETP